MTLVFLILFIVGTAVLVWKMAAESLGDHMPSRCPRCGEPDVPLDPGGAVVGYKRWYHSVRGGRFACRACQTHYKNHPNGTLVEDRD